MPGSSLPARRKKQAAARQPAPPPYDLPPSSPVGLLPPYLTNLGICWWNPHTGKSFIDRTKQHGSPDGAKNWVCKKFCKEWWDANLPDVDASTEEKLWYFYKTPVGTVRFSHALPNHHSALNTFVVHSTIRNSMPTSTTPRNTNPKAASPLVLLLSRNARTDMTHGGAKIRMMLPRQLSSGSQSMAGTQTRARSGRLPALYSNNSRRMKKMSGEQRPTSPSPPPMLLQS